MTENDKLNNVTRSFCKDDNHNLSQIDDFHDQYIYLFLTISNGY